MYALHDAKDENSRSEDQPKVFSGLRSFEETQQDHRDDTDRLHIRNEVEETVIAVGSDSQKSSATKSEEGNYVTRECLLNYHIGPAEQVVIQSHSLNGRFIVAKGKHTGTPKGNWKTTIEMKPA